MSSSAIAHAIILTKLVIVVFVFIFKDFGVHVNNVFFCAYEGPATGVLACFVESKAELTCVSLRIVGEVAVSLACLADKAQTLTAGRNVYQQDATLTAELGNDVMSNLETSVAGFGHMVEVNHDQPVQIGMLLLAPRVFDTLGIGAFLYAASHEDEQRELLLQGSHLILIASVGGKSYLPDDGSDVFVVGQPFEVFLRARPRWTKNCLLIVKH